MQVWPYFQRKRPASIEEYKETALEAERFLSAHLLETETEISLRDSFGSQTNSLYKGLTGILYMYLGFWRILKRPQDKEKIRKIVRYLSTHSSDDYEYGEEHGEFVKGMSLGLYTGMAGIGIILNEVYKEFGWVDAKKSSLAIVQFYLDHVHTAENGIYWTDNSAMFFDAGVTYYLIDCYNTYCSGPTDPGAPLASDLYRAITRSADYIIASGVRHGDRLEIDHTQISFKKNEPNFEFGTAGVGFLLASVSRFTGEQKYLDAAKECAAFVESIAVKQKKGYLIPYKPDLDKDLFYLGNCHGPVGTSKLFFLLYELTGDPHYKDQIIALNDGMESLGAPYRQSKGCWNTLCFCCGPAGFEPFYENLFGMDPDPKWADRIDTVGEILLGSASNSKEGTYWELAFDRTSPDKLSVPIGYYDGTAGIAAMLLRIYDFKQKNRA